MELSRSSLSFNQKMKLDGNVKNKLVSGRKALNVIMLIKRTFSTKQTVPTPKN